MLLPNPDDSLGIMGPDHPKDLTFLCSRDDTIAETGAINKSEFLLVPLED
jgi:hypothetical protein